MDECTRFRKFQSNDILFKRLKVHFCDSMFLIIVMSRHLFTFVIFRSKFGRNRFFLNVIVMPRRPLVLNRLKLFTFVKIRSRFGRTGIFVRCYCNCNAKTPTSS